MPFISEKDYNDIKFGCEQGIDLIALSFVRRAEDVIEVRNLLKEFGKPKIEIIAKIENQEGIDNIDEILQVTDGIMVARGDLGVEVPAEKVPFYQKTLVSKANALGKPVIIATHMLESMIKNPRPTRAEASDVANAILDGCDAIMLSGESAIGAYPLESVEMMDRIALSSENMINYQKRLGEHMIENFHTQNDAISICACECAVSMDDIVAIFAFTETGGTAKRICRYRPSVPLIACTDSVETCRRLSYYCGIVPTIAKYVDDISMCDEIAVEVARNFGFKKGSKIILTGGFGQKHGITNTIRILEI
jgi:pyruvate kinase